jgi:hypothetical protein
MHLIRNACNLRYKDAYTSCYICHAKCKKCTNESYIYTTKSSHTPTHEIKHTPTSPRKRVKVAWSRGLVKISASWSCVGTRIKVIFSFSTLSQKMIPHIYVLGFGMKHWVLCNTYGTTRNRPLEHQIFWQHHVFGCNSWFHSNQRINALRYLGVMATKNVGCVCWNSRCNRLVLNATVKWWLPLWVAIATTDHALW